MGRGGGSRGGGGRSSGGGRGRSSGGRRSSSSGSRGGYSRSRSSFSSGSHYGGHHHHHHYGPRRYYGGGGGGCFSSLLSFIIVMVIIFVSFSMIYGVSIFSIIGQLITGGGSSITTSTVEREPLDKRYVNETGYYTDELGWIENSTVLKNGMRTFYNETGVFPYLYITDTVNGETRPSDEDFNIYVNELYDELFTDEGHILLLFHEYNSDSNYTSWYICGNQAKTVMDEEACNILLDYIDSYYYSDRNESQMFGEAFADAGERIMKKTTPFYLYAIGIVAVVVILIILFSWWKKAKKQKNLEAEQTEKILNANLETIGNNDPTMQELEKKYSVNSQNSSLSDNNDLFGE